jgi:hypothetical protein
MCICCSFWKASAKLSIFHQMQMKRGKKMLCHLFFSEKRGKSKGLGEEKGQKESIETSSNPFW